MNITEKLAAERRGRLAAERRLDQVRAELTEARGRIAAQAQALNDQIAEQRHGLDVARARAEALLSDKQRAMADLARANTAVQIAQRRLWNALETIRDGFAVYDSDLRLVAANRAYVAFFAPAFTIKRGLPYEDMIHMTVERGLLDQDRMAGPEWVAMMLARVRRTRPETMIIPLTDGRSLRIIDRWGEGGDLVSHAADITQTIRREAELDEARRRAEGASRAKSAFLANMSHEIRTPMNGIVGMAELLCDSRLLDDQRLYAETIKSSGDALLAIINDILDMSKAEADRLRLYPEPMALGATLSEVATLVMSSARDKGLRLTLDIDAALPDRFVADPLRLRQIMTNLVGNAVKFTATGHVALRAFGVAAGEGKWSVVLCVEDSGIGIAPDDQHMIFGEFDQVETQTSRQYQGTGLGLAIVSQLARLMGSEVHVDSALGEGACFYLRLTLPLAPDAQAPELATLRLPGHVRRVLVVSDHGVRPGFLMRLLTGWGPEVEVVSDPEAALARLRVGGIDAILSDHMPASADAPALAASMAAQGINVPLILMTACPGVVAASADASAFCAILGLPLTTTALRSALRAVPDIAAGAALDATGLDPTHGSELRPMRVLAAEDNRTNQLVLRKMLDRMGVELCFADNGQDAIDAWRRLSPDLIFMDVSMPVMDGVEATRRIRQAEARDVDDLAEGGPAEASGGSTQAPEGRADADVGRRADRAGQSRRVAIVALTAHPSDSIGPSLKEAGADDLLPKPFRRADLIAAMTRFAPVDTRPPEDPTLRDTFWVERQGRAAIEGCPGKTGAAGCHRHRSCAYGRGRVRE